MGGLERHAGIRLTDRKGIGTATPLARSVLPGAPLRWGEKVRKLPHDIRKILAFAALLSAVGILGYYLYYNTYFGLNLDQKLTKRTENIAQSVYLMCQATDQVMQKHSREIVRGAQDVLAAAGFNLGPEENPFEVFNPYTGHPKKIQLHRLQMTRAEPTDDQGTAGLAALTADLERITGGRVTLLQRMNETGDMLPVCMAMDEARKSRTSSTYLPARGPERRLDPVIAALLRGETYRRPEFFDGSLFLTIYLPIRAAEDQDLLGAAAIRVRDQSLVRLHQEIIDIKVGKTGYVYVLRGTGPDAGQYLISKDGLRDGENILRSVDASGRPFIKAIINKALSLKEQSARVSVPSTHERYPWKNPGEERPRQKLVALVYFEPWDWVIGAGYYEDDF